jgi:SAM-dependent methyltransferase
MKAAIRSCYIYLLPEAIRMHMKGLPGVAWLRDRMFHADTRLHDSYYTAEYYLNDVVEPAAKAAQHVAHDFATRLDSQSAIDVGCGTGEYMAALAEHGITVHGVDLAAAAVTACLAKGLDVQQVDLTRAKSLPWDADLVYSFEVAEHLPESAADAFVDLLCNSARKCVVITAAGPGQPGLCHQNCQPKAYWEAKFAARGFEHDFTLTAELEDRYRELALAPWLYRNLLIMKRG